MSEHFQQKLVTFKNEITGLPDVQAITVSGNVPGTEAMAFYSNYRFDDPERQSRLYAMYAVDKNFTQTYELEIAAGRGFSEDFGTERNNLLLNEVSVKQLGFGNNAEAIGRQVKVESVDTPMIIVGVVKNFHQESLGKAYTPIMFFMQERIRWIPMRFISIKYRGNDIPAMRGKVKSAWDRFFPESTFDHFYLENFFDKQYGQDRKFGNIIAIFSAIAVILAALGLWALSLFTSVLRTKEMGIRKVLGASYSSLFTHLSAEFYYLIIISSLIATPISFWFLSRWLNNYPFHTNLKPWFLLVPVLLLFLICLVVTLRQTIKTVRLNPVDILIDE
jgi:putative ABC transport system permease protein